MFHPRLDVSKEILGMCILKFVWWSGRSLDEARIELEGWLDTNYHLEHEAERVCISASGIRDSSVA